ncbi:MAG: HAMP domain-containing histidine kinase [Verrucomicrobiae bacterium]|nr:HAMP domain-containing histidine kinase [Verrucomicrobiae bacterium]
MIPDPAAQPPRHYAVLAAALMLPALALAAMTAWTTALDRKASMAETTMFARNFSEAAVGAVMQGLGEDAEEGGGPLRLAMKLDGTLLWPARGPWPPQPDPAEATMSGAWREDWDRARRALEGGDALTAVALLDALIEERSEVEELQADLGAQARLAVLRGQALGAAGEAARAVEAWRTAFQWATPGMTTSAGVAIRDLALHGILDGVAGQADRWPAAWREIGETGWIEALAGQPSTPLTEAALDRVRALLPGLAAGGTSRTAAARLEVSLRRRDLARQAHAAWRAAVGEMGTSGRGSGREWPEVLRFELDDVPWLAVARSTDRDGNDREVREYGLHRWEGLVEGARGMIRLLDPAGHFKWALRVGTETGLRWTHEEPAGWFTDEAARFAEAAARGGLMEAVLSAAEAGGGRGLAERRLQGGATVTVAMALVDPASYHAGMRRRGRLLTAVVIAACGLTAAAAWTLWRSLVRQHRLGVRKSNFVAAVSHELRAPLASVRLLVDNLEHDRIPEPDRRRECLRLIGRECRRLGVLVDNVLDLSRIDRGRRRLEPEPTDVAALVEDSAEFASMAGEERGVRVQVLRAPGVESLTATVDGRAVRQALANVLDNALKHAPAGGEIRIRLERTPGGDRFRLGVEDDGPGIPPADRARVFEPFQRLGGELRRETPGIGIGLTIVRHLVEAHGGRVWIEEAPSTGRGTCCVMELPLEPDGPSRPTPPATS